MIGTSVILVIAQSVPVFVVTNLDDLIVLGAFFTCGYRTRNVVIGQLLGIGALTVFSIGIAFGYRSTGLPANLIGSLGVVPVFLGLRMLHSEFFGIASSESEDQPSGESFGGSVSQIFAVAAVTVANGGDNLGIYIPFFTTLGGWAPVFLTMAVFIAMTLVWCFASHRLVCHSSRLIGRERFITVVGRFVPYVLILLGGYVLWSNGTIAWVLEHIF